ncbi:MAG: DUF177 domain-containing protein [Saprospiraceae bacterium]|nr:DUF177 domain-containing protein [Saprospiraceae bacterium]
MNALDHFSLPYQSMKNGLHTFQFKVDDLFFAAFENSPVQLGDFNVEVQLDKRPGISELNVMITGEVDAVCDRCLSDIRMPVKSENHILVKVSNRLSNEIDDEVIFVKEDQSHLNISQIVYEFIVLALPIVNIYNCENDNPRKCNMDVLKKLVASDEAKETQTVIKTWDSLKNLNLD